jgi:beta-phosphoglucomutase
MIKAITFDMDGVLIDAREWHFEALNEALELFGYTISRARHLGEFDGLPTKKKLEKLTELDQFPKHLHQTVNNIKQERTSRIILSKCYPMRNHLALLSYLKSEGYPLGLATNSIRKTAIQMLNCAGIQHYFDSILTNEDIQFSKPHPEIYLKSAEALGIEPSEMLVFEDNPNGIRAASDAGCLVLKVSDPSDVTLEKFLEFAKVKN